MFWVSLPAYSTLVVSTATALLLHTHFLCQDLGREECIIFRGACNPITLQGVLVGN
jgi:hypothetical protein